MRALLKANLARTIVLAGHSVKAAATSKKNAPQRHEGHEGAQRRQGLASPKASLGFDVKSTASPS
jgi:hypothetical protein